MKPWEGSRRRNEGRKVADKRSRNESEVAVRSRSRSRSKRSEEEWEVEDNRESRGVRVDASFTLKYTSEYKASTAA